MYNTYTYSFSILLMLFAGSEVQCSVWRSLFLFFFLSFRKWVLHEWVVSLLRRNNTEHLAFGVREPVQIPPSSTSSSSSSSSPRLRFTPVNLGRLRCSSLSHAKTTETSSAASQRSEVHHDVDVRERTHTHTFLFFFSPHGDVSRSSFRA